MAKLTAKDVTKYRLDLSKSELQSIHYALNWDEREESSDLFWLVDDAMRVQSIPELHLGQPQH